MWLDFQQKDSYCTTSRKQKHKQHLVYFSMQYSTESGVSCVWYCCHWKPHKSFCPDRKSKRLSCFTLMLLTYLVNVNSALSFSKSHCRVFSVHWVEMYTHCRLATTGKSFLYRSRFHPVFKCCRPIWLMSSLIMVNCFKESNEELTREIFPNCSCKLEMFGQPVANNTLFIVNASVQVKQCYVSF